VWGDFADSYVGATGTHMQEITIAYGAGGSATRYPKWLLQFESVIPHGVRIVHVELDLRAVNVPAASNFIGVLNHDSAAGDSDNVSFSGTGTETLYMTPPNNDFLVGNGHRAMFRMLGSLSHGSTCSIEVKVLRVHYRW